MTQKKLAILGCGTMGRAVLGGLLATGFLSADDVVVTVRREADAAALAQKYGVTALVHNARAAAMADTVLIAVKPQVVTGLLQEEAMAEALSGKLVLSICAGVTLAKLQRFLPTSSLVRAMPNTPCVIRQGMTVLCPGPGSTPAQIDFAEQLFTKVGRVRILEEKHLDAVTGLSGSGPAFVCVILEALADGGVMMGLPRDVAVELAAQTMQGTARLVLETGEHPAALKDEVTTPAGCTIAGLLTMEDRGIRSTLARTIEEAARVASTLGGD